MTHKIFRIQFHQNLFWFLPIRIIPLAVSTMKMNSRHSGKYHHWWRLRVNVYFSEVCRKHDLIVLSDEIYGICGFNNHKNISFSKVRHHLAESTNLFFLISPWEKSSHCVNFSKFWFYYRNSVSRSVGDDLLAGSVSICSMGCLNDSFLVLQGRDYCLFGNIEMVRWWRLETWIHDCTKRAQSLITGES